MFPSACAKQEFSYPPQQNDDSLNICKILIACILAYMVWQYASMVQFSPSSCISGLHTTSETPAKQTDDLHFSAEANAKMKNAPNCHNLTLCKDAKCKDYKTCDPIIKAQFTQDARAFAEKNKDAILMVFSPWCPHCETAMPKFIDASKKAKIPFVLINAELVERSLISGDKAIANVTHFPYIAHGKKVLEEAPTEEAILRLAEPAAAPAQAEEASNEEADSKMALDLLFS